MRDISLLSGDCRDRLKELPDGSVDSVVTDPPYELGFMGKSWDSTGVAYDVTVWRECLRVLKPGGHLLAFGGSRTYHRLACSVEDAGFEIRDQIMWVYGSGFPKSLDVSKAIDKQAGAQREVVGQGRAGKNALGQDSGWNKTYEPDKYDLTVPATDAAKRWEGWGTALKPAHEPIVLARKPLDGTVANNVLTHGVGGINIDKCRVETDDTLSIGSNNRTNASINFGMADDKEAQGQNPSGRWPANLIHDGSDEVLELFPDTGKSTGGRIGKKSMGNVTNVPAGQYEAGDPGYGDSGSAARFFYCAKANKRDRNEGLDGFEEKRLDERTVTGMGTFEEKGVAKQANHHPTVKPTELMRYLCRLITPPNGIILDPFTGSGSTGKAAILEGFSFIGVEQSEEYIKIAEARIRFGYDSWS